jgi:uncharacterized membrane protein
VSDLQEAEHKLSFIIRLPAIDSMRGIVMVLMTLDHASHAFNADRYVTDSAAWYRAGSEIPTEQFLTRWITHLCAPTFIFLAGFVLAFSVARRQANGEAERTIDGYLLKRGIFILLLDPLWMSFGFGEGLAGLAVWAGGGQRAGLIGTFLITGGPVFKGVFVLYPLLPWLASMILGWVCGKLMLRNDLFNPVRFFSSAAAVSFIVFFVARGLNHYGNMLLYRYNNSILQWLHVCKYPPSLTFSVLELGLMFLILALLFAWYRNRNASDANPLQVFGRAPLFFYIIHVHLLALASWLLNMHQAGGLTETYLATAAALLVLYPLCRWYGRVKKAHPRSLLRYI